MLTSFDDYPIHQTPEPIAHTGSGDRNHYDRYFFNGYTPDGSLYFAAALGLYPNRSVMDAAFSVVRDGVQTSVHASRRAPLDRADMTVGPITVRVDAPLRRLTVSIDGNDAEVEGELTFVARTDPCEEPRFTMRGPSGRATFDYTRLTQFGEWQGRLRVGGDELTIGDRGSRVVGSRDRSWGVRPVGEREDGAPGPLPQFFWLWAPVNFDDCCTHFDVQELADGRRWHDNGMVLPVPAGDAERMASVAWDIDWRPGTRRADRARVTLSPFAGADRTIDLEPILDFQMLGLGYLHPTWGHGMWKGDDAVGIESWRLADLDPMAPGHLHVQQLCRATMGDRVGAGILEVLVIGPHEGAGFAELLDPARPVSP
ncbi:MAG: hypothetical protein ACYDH6_02745 [Acidimicrobiales bacterium]